MTKLVHVIVGPEQHGVVEYALRLHEQVGGPLVRAETVAELPAELPAGPIHLTFTDHLFGSSPDSAVTAVLNLASGRALSISCHDIPQPEEGSERFARRAKAYRRLAASAQLLVVNSHHEAAFFAPTEVEVVHLPLTAAPASTVEPDPTTVGILGYIYPGKGHEDVLRALTGTDMSLLALGKFATGHEYLDKTLRDLADELGVSYSTTGFIPDIDLHARMQGVGVPVCAHRHFSASGSLMQWLSVGRKVLVSDSSYSRELAELWPNFITTVPADSWTETLRSLPDDFATPLTPPTNWTWAEVSNRFRELWSHPPFELAGNHLPAATTRWPDVSVIIPYFENQADLNLLLEALHNQDYPGEVEIIVADDGSRQAPNVPDSVTVVRQDDQGFRAAAARNLGASRARGEILAFLDGDTIPHVDYLRESVAVAARDPRAVVVGKRVHAGSQPEWLADAYARTANLATADDTSWRFLISAVLTCSQDFFTRIGGFDASMVGYGGEDWDFAWRAWNAGAIFRHVPTAIAEHAGPDWGARNINEPEAEKNVESVALARRITHPLARPTGMIAAPDIVVFLPDNVQDWPAGAVEKVILGWLQLGAVACVLPRVPPLFADDPRVSASPVVARVSVALDLPFIPADLAEIYRAEELGGLVTLFTSGLSDRCATVIFARREALRSWGVEVAPCLRMFVPGEVVNGPVRLERLFAGW
ncbi:glycosyltransferase [Corynebacterium epidermidicanis]|uniref:Glycosyl transferase n=1 Tax=Corynebacterium epidermidicanis TaxID=1050174 RepID=A0A0G3GL77_9CORY|nr:glycosyltransferase [Corynebacterium epidermidicanis]AKK01991.1 glycosyl transferase [Corynebacterium epidermidicanis]